MRCTRSCAPAGYRLTPQRQLVLGAVERARARHARRGPERRPAQGAQAVNISTIYRTLELLEELGLVRHAPPRPRAPTYHAATVRRARPPGVPRVRRGSTEVPPETVEPLAERLRDQYGFDTDVGHLTVFGSLPNVAKEPTACDRAGRGARSTPTGRPGWQPGRNLERVTSSSSTPTARPARPDDQPSAASTDQPRARCSACPARWPANGIDAGVAAHYGVVQRRAAHARGRRRLRRPVPPRRRPGQRPRPADLAALADHPAPRAARSPASRHDHAGPLAAGPRRARDVRRRRRRGVHGARRAGRRPLRWSRGSWTGCGS